MLYHYVHSLVLFPTFVQNLSKLKTMNTGLTFRKKKHLFLTKSFNNSNNKKQQSKDHINAVKIEGLEEFFKILTQLKLYQHQNQIPIWRRNHTYPQISSQKIEKITYIRDPAKEKNGESMKTEGIKAEIWKEQPAWEWVGSLMAGTEVPFASEGAGLVMFPQSPLICKILWPSYIEWGQVESPLCPTPGLLHS